MDLKFPMTDEDVQRYLAEQAEIQAKRPIKSRHAHAGIGSKTERGGEVATASTGLMVRVDGKDIRIACVGDVVRYPDGSESRITSGAGFAAMFDAKPIAIVGSHIENGDTIISSPQSAVQITQYADDEPIPGLLQPGYTAPLRAPA